MIRVETARSVAEVERLEQLWNALPWEGEQAEHPYFLAAARARAGSSEPLALLVVEDERPVAAAVGRIEWRRFDTRLGYLRVYAPQVRVFQVVPGGLVAEPDAIAQLATAVRSVLDTVDAVALPALPVDSPLFAAFAALGGPLERQRFVPVWSRRRLVVPSSFDEFLASRSRKIRAGVRYDSKKLLDALGDELRVEIVRDAASVEPVARDLDVVSASTYQRALGAGFVDTPDRRELLRVGLEHGWTRVYLLRRNDEAIAYWLCSVHHGTLVTSSTGYRPEYAPYRVGIYLLMRVIEDACADPGIDVVDFGPGRSGYKRHFSSEAYEERNIVVFAPTFRGRRINVVRTAVGGAAWAARRALDATGATDRLKTVWRARLR